jgi:hypothetical protein
MKHFVLVAFAAASLLLLSSGAASAFGVKDVVAMTKDGVADSLILQKIAYSRTTFHLDARDMHDLKGAGVSDEVVSAMLRTEGRDDRYPVYGPYYYPRHYYVPYAVEYPYAYAPYYYPRATFSLGLRFGGGHRGYFPRRYR